MLGLFRDGFYRDFSLLLLVAILLGSLFAAGVAWAVDTYFGETLKEMIGEYGEYDLVLHVREEAGEAALRELEKIAEEQMPGSRVNESLAIAGQANFFFAIAPEYRRPEVMDNLAGFFGAVPGLNGYTVVLQPSVLVRGLHPQVGDQIRSQVDLLNGVAFSFLDQNSLFVVLESVEHAQEVNSGVKRILDQYQIVEVRYPMGFEIDTRQAANEVRHVLADVFSVRDSQNITPGSQGEDIDAFLRSLKEMRRFLIGYASKVRIEAEDDAHLVPGEQILAGDVVVEVLGANGATGEGLIVEGVLPESAEVLIEDGYRLSSDGSIGRYIGQVYMENEQLRLTYAIDESLQLLMDLDDLAAEAIAAVDNADILLERFQEALMQLEVLQVQISQLQQGIHRDGAVAQDQLLVSLLINNLMRLIAGADGSEAGYSLRSLENLDMEAMHASLEAVATQIANVQGIDAAAIIDQIERVRDGLPQLADEEIGRSVRLIDAYISGQVIPGERVQVLVHSAVLDESLLEDALRQALNNPYVAVYTASVGMVNPDPHSELFRVLHEVRATIAGLMAFFVAVALLLFDQASILSTMKWLRSQRSHSSSASATVLEPVEVFGAVVGMILLVSVYWFSGSSIPYVSMTAVAVFGLIFGALTVVFSERFSPVNVHEVQAGQALGLTHAQIMREIVIPGARPGLLALLNRWRKQF